MTDFSHQCRLSASVIQNGGFTEGDEGWTIVSGTSGETVRFENGKLILDGTEERCVVQQDVSSRIDADEVSHLQCSVDSGGGVVSYGSGGLSLSVGTHRIPLEPNTGQRIVMFDVEGGSLTVDEVTLRPAVYSE